MEEVQTDTPDLPTPHQVLPVLYPLTIVQLVIVQLRVTGLELKVYAESGGRFNGIMRGC